MIAIPLDQLTTDVLDAVIEAFVLREGTDYGEIETDLARKRAQVRLALQRGEAVVCWDDATESTSIVPIDSLPEAERLHVRSPSPRYRTGARDDPSED